MSEWLDVPEYMRPVTPEEFKAERVRLYEEGFGDKLTDSKRRARGFRHLQLGYRETDENHLLGPGVPEWHIICELCGGSVLRLLSSAQAFNFDVVWLETGVIRHMHHKHPDLMGVKNAGEYGENQAMDRPGSGLLRSRYDRSVPGYGNQERHSGSSESGS